MVRFNFFYIIIIIIIICLISYWSPILEFSLDDFNKKKRLKTNSKPQILAHLIQDPLYAGCLADVSDRYQLREIEVNQCAKVLYHELSKHAHGNTAELSVIDTEHSMTEVAAMEAVFCALKKHDCFHLNVRIIVGYVFSFLFSLVYSSY